MNKTKQSPLWLYGQFNMVVSKTTAQALRNMGYNEYCDCYVHTDTDQEDDCEMWAHRQHRNSDLPNSACRIAAPYVSDALIWLMQFKDVILLEVKYNPADDYDLFYTVMLAYGKYNVVTHATYYQTALYKALEALVTDNEM